MKRLLIIFGLAVMVGVVIVEIISQIQTVEMHTSLAAISKKELINESEIIIRGTVKEALPSKWTNPDNKLGIDVPNIIVTDIVFDINEVYKGTPYDDKNIKVRVRKGKIGLKTYKSDAYPNFEIGDEVILLLSKETGIFADNSENYYILDGARQGAFFLTEDFGTDKVFSNNKETIKLSTIKAEIKNS